jgi:protein-S-isoprenylcysteine O-methyltransferase Ste14
LGIVLLGLGFWLMMAGWSQFKRAGTNINTFGRPDRLVTGGLYRYSRNPMYLGMALMLAGVGMLLGALSPFVGVLLFLIIADPGYIAYEEKALQARFGQEYATYQSNTRRWI